MNIIEKVTPMQALIILSTLVFTSGLLIGMGIGEYIEMRYINDMIIEASQPNRMIHNYGGLFNVSPVRIPGHYYSNIQGFLPIDGNATLVEP